MITEHLEPAPTTHTRLERRARSSAINISANVLLAIGGVLVCENTNAIAPIQQPTIFTGASSSSARMTKDTVSPKEDVEQIFRQLTTVEDLANFLREHCTHRNAEGVHDFISTFRCRPEELQNNEWTGPCNTFAEFTAQWAYRHGGTPYLVSLYPKGTLSKLDQSWHQFAVNKLPNGHYIIFDNTSIYLWKQSLAEYIAKDHPNRTMMPIGGLVKWQLLKDTWRARFSNHLAPNETELECAPLPFNKTQSQPPPQLAEQEVQENLTTRS